MTILTPEQLQTLQTLAEAATPGAWKASAPLSRNAQFAGVWEAHIRIVDKLPDGRRRTRFPVVCNAHGCDNQANAEFIAAANPTAVLDLLASHEALRAERDNLEREVNQLVESLHDTQTISAERDALKAALRMVEFDEQGCCILCGGKDHYPDCEVDAAFNIGAARGDRP